MIGEIERIFIEYTPRELYYKVLFELFGEQLLIARKLLKPIELEIDEMVNKLYGITAEAEEIEETEEELELVDDLNEEEDD